MKWKHTIPEPSRLIGEVCYNGRNYCPLGYLDAKICGTPRQALKGTISTSASVGRLAPATGCAAAELKELEGAVESYNEGAAMIYFRQWCKRHGIRLVKRGAR